MAYGLSHYGRPGSGGPFLLSDHGLEEAISKGDIVISPAITPDQIQPATLDVRIGRVKLYDDEVRAKMAVNMKSSLSIDEILNYEPTDKFAKVFPDVKDARIVIPPESFVEIFFHEYVEFSRDRYDVNVDLRSSRGRLGLTLNSTRIQEGKEGKYIGLFNKNPNPIVLYGQDKFAQLFFCPREGDFDGHMVEDPGEAKGIASEVCEKSALGGTLGETFGETLGHYFVFRLGDYVMKFKKNIGEIDTKKKYEESFLYDSYATSEINEMLLHPGEAAIAQLTPKLNLPADVGIHLLHNIPYAQSPNPHSPLSPNPEMMFLEGHCLNAGWVDPGYRGNATAHPMMRKFSSLLRRGDPIAFGVICKYNKPVKRPYGSEKLGSHYQDSKGTGFKS